MRGCRMKRIALMLLIGVLLLGCSNKQNNQSQQSQSDQNNNSVIKNEEIIYKSDQYGFEFLLPDSWKGYTIIDDTWEGFAAGETKSQKIIETGPLISIRHPKWSSEEPRQDIPIMVFTLSQWDSLRKEQFHIGAAPIGPSEIDKNSKYVFALPARYNFSFPEGYQEVEDILNNKPLKPTENFKAQ